MRRLSFLLPLSLFSSVAFAQTTSDLMPAPPPAPPGGGGIVYPGAPAPIIQRNPIQAGPPGAVTKPTGRTGYDIYEPLSTFGSGGGGGSGVEVDRRGAPGFDSAEVPETHVVKKGDTLWEIAGYYFHNAWTWPKLWSYNPSITNPHWIYPGDVVRLVPAGGAAPVAAAPVNIPVAEHPRAPVHSTGIFLRQNGFVEPDELKNAGTIIASKEEKIMLSTLDETYVEMNPERPLRIGERYTIYRPLEEVKHPVTHKKLGLLVQILGEAEVKTITDGKIARCAIVDSTDPIERGYKIGPLRRQFKIVEPARNAQELEGVVVTTLRPIHLVAAQALTFVDKGKADGVVVGNRFFITRRGDGYVKLQATGPVDDKRFPREIIGEILVVDVRENLSTGLVTRTIKDTRIGDRAEARKGY